MEIISEFFSNYWLYLTIIGFLLLFTLPWLFVWRYRANRRWLLANGRPATAKILKIWDTGLTIGASSSSGSNSSRGGNMRGIGLLLEVHPADGQPYQAKTREQLHLADLARIAPGMTVELRVHPNKAGKVIISQWHVM
ncbi:MAG: hypothetical protein H6658_05520 [Ardenticatenaceae bacterium]|nr:hypothetical protein [Ardenticatenaceae bacterium]